MKAILPNFSKSDFVHFDQDIGLYQSVCAHKHGSSHHMLIPVRLSQGFLFQPQPNHPGIPLIHGTKFPVPQAVRASHFSKFHYFPMASKPIVIAPSSDTNAALPCNVVDKQTLRSRNNFPSSRCSNTLFKPIMKCSDCKGYCNVNRYRRYIQSKSVNVKVKPKMTSILRCPTTHPAYKGFNKNSIFNYRLNYIPSHNESKAKPFPEKGDSAQKRTKKPCKNEHGKSSKKQNKPPCRLTQKGQTCKTREKTQSLEDRSNSTPPATLKRFSFKHYQKKVKEPRIELVRSASHIHKDSGSRKNPKKSLTTALKRLGTVNQQNSTQTKPSCDEISRSQIANPTISKVIVTTDQGQGNMVDTNNKEFLNGDAMQVQLADSARNKMKNMFRNCNHGNRFDTCIIESHDGWSFYPVSDVRGFTEEPQQTEALDLSFPKPPDQKEHDIDLTYRPAKNNETLKQAEPFEQETEAVRGARRGLENALTECESKDNSVVTKPVFPNFGKIRKIQKSCGSGNKVPVSLKQTISGCKSKARSSKSRKRAASARTEDIIPAKQSSSESMFSHSRLEKLEKFLEIQKQKLAEIIERRQNNSHTISKLI